jgi:hypothetical protein
LALGKSSLAWARQWEAGQSSAGAAAPPAASTAELAQFLKSTLDMRKEWQALQGAACTSLLHRQLDLLSTAQASAALHDVVDLQLDFASAMSAQLTTSVKAAAERARVCVEDLRKAHSKDELSFVLAACAGDLGKRLQDDAAQAAALINSASTAANILTHKTLDGMIAAGPAGPAA